MWNRVTELLPRRNPDDQQYSIDVLVYRSDEEEFVIARYEYGDKTWNYGDWEYSKDGDQWMYIPDPIPTLPRIDGE